MHHTTESSSPVCFLPRSQAPRCAAHRGVKIKIFGSLRLFLKGHSGEILLRVITSIIKEKIWRKKFWFAKTKILSPRCDAHRETEPWSTISAKSNQNSRIFQPVYQGPRWVRIVEKTGGRKSRDTHTFVMRFLWPQFYLGTRIDIRRFYLLQSIYKPLIRVHWYILFAMQGLRLWHVAHHLKC